MPRALLLSIRPRYADKIFDGTKTVELRRVRPRLSTGDLVLVYVSSPVKELRGAVEVAKVESASPTTLWKKVRKHAGLTRKEFLQYYEGAPIAYGIFLKRAWVLDIPIQLENLRRRRSNFRPPQSYHYFSEADVIGIGVSQLMCARSRSTLRNIVYSGR